MSYSPQQCQAPCHGRRSFIRNSVKAAGSLILTAPLLHAHGINVPRPAAGLSVQDVIDIILREVPNAPFKQTVDTIKSGNPQATVTGIVTTMFATVKVIRQAAQINANFIIAHEPTFYNHLDDRQWVQPNEVLKQKDDLLAKHKLTVWRFHDYWHSVRPDGIRYGVVKKANWLPYFQPDSNILTIPAISLKEVAMHLKKSLGITQLRVLGDPGQRCSRIALLPGAAGGQTQISTVEKAKPDVLIVGEVHEWETAEYIRDAQALGSKMSLIILGHAVSEEPGMEWLVEWLQPKLPGIKITHIASGDPFTWI